VKAADTGGQLNGRDETDGGDEFRVLDRPSVMQRQKK
jgi:hypothetical protein